LVPFLQAVNSDVPEETRQLIEILNQLVETHPRDAKSYTMLADGYFNTGQLRTSLVSYQKAEELEPGIASVWMQHMETLLYLDEYDQCIEIAEEALIYFPNQVEIYLMAAEAALKNEKKTQALSYLSACDFMLSKDEILRQQYSVLELLSNNDSDGLAQWMDQQSKSKFTLPDAASVLFELFSVDHQGFIDQVILQAQGPLKENYEAQLAAAYALAEIGAWQSSKEYLDFCLRLGGSIIPDTFLLLMDVGSALQKEDYVKLAKMRLDRMGYQLKTAP
jgi:tetratricopeptide (TPR) repeat protein